MMYILIYLGQIPRNFKIFVFKLNLPFLIEKCKNNNLGEFPDFYESTSTLYMIFAIFPENGHSVNSYFRSKFQKSFIGWIRKNPGIHPYYYSCVFLKNDDWGFKMKIFKFHGIQPRYIRTLCECVNAIAKRIRVIKVVFFTVGFDEMQIMNEKE